MNDKKLCGDVVDEFGEEIGNDKNKKIVVQNQLLVIYLQKSMNMMMTGGIEVQTQQNGADGADLSYVYNGTDIQMIAHASEGNVYFAGHSSNNSLNGWVTGEIPARLKKLVTTAINNRTRELNFARLCLSLSDGEISEEEYDRIIAEQSDDYIIRCHIKPTENDIRFASQLAPELLGISDTDDLAVLFSFDESEIHKFINR